MWAILDAKIQFGLAFLKSCGVEESMSLERHDIYIATNYDSVCIEHFKSDDISASQII